MLQVENGNQSVVLEQIVREGVPKRLAPYTGLPGVLTRGQHENVKP